MTFRSCPSFSLQKIFREDASKAHIFPKTERKSSQGFSDWQNGKKSAM